MIYISITCVVFKIQGREKVFEDQHGFSLPNYSFLEEATSTAKKNVLEEAIKKNQGLDFEDFYVMADIYLQEPA